MTRAPDRGVHATRRFGLGAREGELGSAAGAPLAYVTDQLVPVPPLSFPVEDPADEWARVLSFRARRQRARRDRADGKVSPKALRKAIGKNPLPAIIERQIGARLEFATRSDRPFIERLVLFWSDHFTVSRRSMELTVAMLDFETHAIRPHVTGRFRDLLGAVVRHPAMLIYLDNVNSTGPNSPAGKRRGVGLNENLAREIMELHTLGADGPQTQADVQALAAMLTGWGTGGRRSRERFLFRFNPRRHEPGPKTLLGRTFPEAGVDEPERALDMLAEHPATARYVARSLAVHFVTDRPDPEMVDAMARAFLDTEGDLPSVYRAMLAHPSAWSTPARKVLPPFDMVCAACRAIGDRPDDAFTYSLLAALGHVPWTASSPAGWPVEDEAWLAADALLERLDWMKALLERLDFKDDGGGARELVRRQFGAAAGQHLRLAVERADSERQAHLLVLMSPAFQRR